jgi:hypothetical protein
VGQNGGPYGFNAFAMGYFDAAESVWKSMANGDGFVDTLVYPFAFLYRQGIELAIKDLIYFLSAAGGGSTGPALTHKLLANWETLRPLLHQYHKRFGYGSAADARLGEIERVITAISEFDPDSFVFRYPEDKKGQLYIKGFSRIDVAQLQKALSETANWFWGVMEGVREDHMY